ncbi:unnamed protein product [Rhizoctonia solani]|uniref:Uncharacterized protein n=1 Tax=Rhizoctonia solani TaxID=456999 RepID=A0A8H3H5A3_9AGAM|nr:unnamed protein product [Rhizoctonia solani]
MVLSFNFQLEEPPADSQGQADPSKAPIQIGTWIDGFQLEVRSCKGMRVNMDYFNTYGVKVQQGFKAVSSHGYMLNSSDPSSKVMIIARIPLRISQTEMQSLDTSRLEVAQFDFVFGEFRVVRQPESNMTSTGLRVLPHAVEIEASTLDVRWLLVSPEDPPSAGSVAPKPSSAVTSILPPPPTTADDPEVMTTNPPAPSPTGVNTFIVATIPPISLGIPTVVPLTEGGTEKVMKISGTRLPSRSRMRRMRYSKSHVL